jgi:glycosyltransferase involved in cell wall biosynthesis
MKISVIVCTYNGSKRIKGTFQSLLNMETVPGLQWELILVDNNSNDDTAEIIKDFARTSGLNVRYLLERKQGLAHARNTGVTAAKGDVLVFTDDDCIVDLRWLIGIFEEFRSDPALSGLGGRVELYNKNDFPVTTRTFREKMLFSSPKQLFTLLPGCNMAFRRRVFDIVGKFDPHLGAGTRIASAEDSDIFYRVYKARLKMIYSPDVLVYHNHGRSTAAQVERLNRGYTIGQGAFYCKHILRADNVVLKMACRVIVGKMRALITNLYNRNAVNRHLRSTYWLTLGALYKLTSSRVKK